MMCNINMVYMLVSVFVCLFISEDFRSGYAKNLFTVRAGKGDYIISKTLAGFVCGVLMLIAYLIGAMFGGAISGLSFALHGLLGLALVKRVIDIMQGEIGVESAVGKGSAFTVKIRRA